MRLRVTSHRFAELILERDFELEWAEVRSAIAQLRMPTCAGSSVWGRLRAELIDSLTRLNWVPDLPVPAWHRAQYRDERLNVDLEKRGVAVMVASEGRGMYEELFALNAAATGRNPDIGVYVVAGTALGVTLNRVPTLDDVAVPLSYRLGGMSLPVALVGVEPAGASSSAALRPSQRVA